jgi:MFS family permease
MPTDHTIPDRSPGEARSTGRIFYGWTLVGVAGFLLTLMSLTVFQGLGTFVVALQDQFGWSRTAISGAFALARVQGSIIGPFEGLLIDRVGIRKMVLIGYSMMGVGFILLSQIDHIWQFYAAFTVVTVGSGLSGWLAMITLVNNWFIRKRSIAMATAMSGVHMGGFLVPALAFGIDSQGFRTTTLFIGILILAVIVPVTKMIRNKPEDVGLLPDGVPQAPQRSVGVETPVNVVDGEPDFTVREALRTPAFWLLMLVQLSSSVATVSLATHLVPKLTDIGMSLGNAGIVVLTSTAIAVPSQFVFGYIADRFSKPPIIFALLALQATSLIVIAMADSVATAYLFAVMYGISFGGRMPLTTSLRGDYFGRRAFATITGLSFVPNNAFTIAAPLFAGYMFDQRGSYVIPFTVFAAMSYVGAIVVLFVRKPKQPH